MKKLPEHLLQSLEGVEGFDREAFVKVHEAIGQITSVRINAVKLMADRQTSIVNRQTSIGPGADPASLTAGHFIHDSRLAIDDKVPWTEYGLYLKERPSFTFDPFFHAGCYYVQEASSMFLEQPLKQLTDLSQPLKVLDLCAAPGGKSTHIQSILSSESLLVSNEVIRARTNVLADNIIKWGTQNVIVTNNDPSSFQKLESYFDVMVVDAPCSGSGLFRKDAEAMNEWSLSNVQLCSQRQQRILADALPALKEHGLLIYSTCSYSKEEDEDIADWLIKEFGMKNEELHIDPEWQIVETVSPATKSKGYRFYPDKLRGEGLFMACFRNTKSGRPNKLRASKTEKPTDAERSIVQPWVRQEGLELFKQNGLLFAFPEPLIADYSAIASLLHLRYAGTGVGQVMKDKLVPEHALALSSIISDGIPSNEVSYEDAIKYLQRQEFNFNSSGKGWQLVRYKGFNLGWINVLQNRINNYYPKELRILKQSNDSSFEK